MHMEPISGIMSCASGSLISLSGKQEESGAPADKNVQNSFRVPGSVHGSFLSPIQIPGLFREGIID